MQTLYFALAFFLLLNLVAGMWRVLCGPTAADRMLAAQLFGTTFHPTFLYESVWNLALCALLIAIDHRTQLRPGRLFALYLGGYFAGRFWVEGLRIDTAPEIAGLRWNQWVSLAVVCGVATLFIVDTMRRRGVGSRTAVDRERSLV